MPQQLQIRRGTAAQWTSANTVLMSGEQGYETDTGKMKVGDGTTAWTSLAYFSTGSGGSSGNATSINGVTVSGTPGNGQVLTASSASAASWATPASGGSGTSRFYASVRNVKLDYGATGNGTTDDTTAIQNAFNGLTEATAVTVYFPKGEYKLTAAIKIPFCPGLHIIGDGGEQITKLVQYTAGQSVLWFSRSITHDVYVADLTLMHNVTQTNTASWAVRYYDDTDNGASWFKHVFDRVTIFCSYRGWGIDTGSGSPTMWNFKWRDCRVKGMMGSVIMMRGVGPNGQPINVVDGMLVENTNTSIISVEPAFDIGANEFLFQQLDIEGWASSIVTGNEGSFVTMYGLHVEQHQFVTANSYIFDLENTGFDLRGFSIDGTATSGNTAVLAVFFLKGGDNAARIENGLITIKGGSSSTAYVKEVVWRGDHDADYRPIQWFNVIATGSNTINMPGSGSRATESVKSLAMFGLMADGRTRGTQLPYNSPLYMYSPNGTRYKVTITDGGAFQITAG